MKFARARPSRRRRRSPAELAKAPSCHRIVFETGRMAPILFHGKLNQLGLPVVCVESRQAYQALKSLATHKTDRNDALRGLAHLARTGFFKPVHVKSLQAHALRSLIIARKKLVGQRVTLENQIRGLAVVFGIPAASRARRSLPSIRLSRQKRQGIAGLSAAMRGLITARTAVMTAGRCDRRRHETYDKSLGGLPSADDHPRRRPTDCARLCGCDRRSLRASGPDPGRRRRLSGIGPQTVISQGEVDYVGSHLEVPGDRRVRTLLYEAANVMLTRYKGQLKLKDWAFAIARRSTMRKARVALARRLAIIMHAMLRDETEFGLALSRQSTRQEAESSSQEERRSREGADDGADFVARGQPVTDCDFNRAALHSAYPIKCRTSTQRTQAPESVDTPKSLSPLDPLENDIRK